MLRNLVTKLTRPKQKLLRTKQKLLPEFTIYTNFKNNKYGGGNSNNCVKTILEKSVEPQKVLKSK